MKNHCTISTRCKGDGSEACSVVYYQRQIVATFPINDPSSSDAYKYAKQFVWAMNENEVR